MNNPKERIMQLAAKWLLAAWLIFPAAAQGQESTEDRMRDALRQSVTEMRAAQDQAAQAAADLQKAQAEKAALQAQLDSANAKVAAAPATKPADLEALKAQLLAAQQAGSSLQQLNARLQANLESANTAAQAKDDQNRKAEAQLKTLQSSFTACKSANGKLIGVSEDVLHLYESQSFRSLLLKSYEPILGLAKVKLESIIQQYDDRIQDQAYVAPSR
jgi:septal ring factor EnvC (AmiA/AmiB activator)